MTIGMRIFQKFHIERHRELGRGKYQAKQVREEIFITATGDSPTPNYKVWLAFGPEDVFPPVVELWWMPPVGIQIQLMTPFSVHLTFDVGPQCVGTIRVRDAEGVHEVPVEQVEDAGDDPGAQTRVPANSFRLMLDKIPVHYATTSLIGEPMFSYGEQHFTGDALRIVETSLGQEVTVVLEQVPDLKVVTFSLLVPPVLLAGTKPAKVAIPGVTATHHTTIAGPPLGQNIGYELAMLRGSAEYIVS